MDTLTIILQLISNHFSSDAAFEAAAGLKPKTVYDWKRGKSSSYLKMLSRISELFNVTTDYLLGNEQKNKPADSLDRLPLTDMQQKVWDKLMKLSPDDLEFAKAQIDLILSRKDNQSK